MPSHGIRNDRVAAATASAIAYFHYQGIRRVGINELRALQPAFIMRHDAVCSGSGFLCQFDHSLCQPVNGLVDKFIASKILRASCHNPLTVKIVRNDACVLCVDHQLSAVPEAAASCYSSRQ